MMPGKPPYFPFYPTDFAADGIVEAMTTEQVGAYMLLLCKAWAQEPAGSIPDDDTVLARWARLTPARWAEIRSGVLAAFTPAVDGRLHQKRMEHEHAKLILTIKKKSRGGKKGARARWAENMGVTSDGIPIDIANGIPIDTPNGIRMPRAFGSGYGSDSGSELLRDGGAGEGSKLVAGFNAFWSAWPNKVARLKAFEVWRKLAPDAELVQKIIEAIERQKTWTKWKKDGGEYIPHPSTWLNQRRWEDEIPSEKQPETMAEQAARLRSQRAGV